MSKRKRDAKLEELHHLEAEAQFRSCTEDLVLLSEVWVGRDYPASIRALSQFMHIAVEALYTGMDKETYLYLAGKVFDDAEKQLEKHQGGN